MISLTALILETFRLNGELLIAGDALVADLGLTSARWQVIGAIGLSPNPLPVAHVARSMGLSRQAVQRIVNDLVARELLRFAPNPHHQRAKLVLLTEKGMATYQSAMERQQPWVNELGNGLSAKAITTAHRVLMTLRERLQTQNNLQTMETNDVEEYA
jgi:DNA-binding MarR family transcriptional regulator